VKKSVYLALSEITKKWTMPIRNWGIVKNRSYEENNKIYKWIRGKNASTSIAALYYLDSNGNKKRFELYDPSKDYRIDLRIGGASNYFDASTLIFFTQRKKKAKFIRLDLHNN
jgi:hypothetical protein